MITSVTGTTLTAEARQAAVLDGAGYSKAEIAKVVDVGESSVARWRRDEDYKKLVKNYRDRHAGEIEPLLHRVKTELLKVIHEEAPDALRRALTAVDGKGAPKHSVQLSALEAALRRVDELSEKEGPQSGGPAPAVIVAQIGPPPEQPTKPHADAESTATEV